MERENNEKKPDEKKKIIVSYYSGEWEVKNEGDSAVLFRSTNKEDAVKFAQDIARSYNIKVEIEDENKKENKVEERKEKDVEEKKTKNIDRSGILVIKDRDEWVVKTLDDSAVLFSSREKEQALKFAKQMGHVHDVRVDVVD